MLLAANYSLRQTWDGKYVLSQMTARVASQGPLRSLLGGGLRGSVQALQGRMPWALVLSAINPEERMAAHATSCQSCWRRFPGLRVRHPGSSQWFPLSPTVLPVEKFCFPPYRGEMEINTKCHT